MGPLGTAERADRPPTGRGRGERDPTGPLRSRQGTDEPVRRRVSDSDAHAERGLLRMLCRDGARLECRVVCSEPMVSSNRPSKSRCVPRRQWTRASCV